MSERKTTEIKLRVTPAEKAAWQLAAEAEGVGLSELIRREMNAKAARPAADAELLAPVISAEVYGMPHKSWTFEARKSG